MKHSAVRVSHSVSEGKQFKIFKITQVSFQICNVHYIQDIMFTFRSTEWDLRCNYLLSLNNFTCFRVRMGNNTTTHVANAYHGWGWMQIYNALELYGECFLIFQRGGDKNFWRCVRMSFCFLHVKSVIFSFHVLKLNNCNSSISSKTP